MKKLSILGVSAAATVLLFSAGQANAYDCTNADYGTAATYEVSGCEVNNTANSNGTTTTDSEALIAGVTNVSGLVSQRLASIQSGGSGNDNMMVSHNGFSASTNGMAAGNGDDRWGLWVSGSWEDYEDDNVTTAAEGTLWTGAIGMDYKVTPRFLVGLAVAYEDSEFNTEYNATSTGVNGTLDWDGYTVAPYLAYAVNNHVSLQASAGWSDLDYDTIRFDGGGDTKVTGSTNSDRYFVSGGVGINYPIRNWRLMGDTALLYATEDKDAFTESNGVVQSSNDTDLFQYTLDARLGYQFRYIMPYLRAGLEWNIDTEEVSVATVQTRRDEEEFAGVFGAGFTFQLAPNFTGGIEATTTEFRDDIDEYGATANLRVTF